MSRSRAVTGPLQGPETARLHIVLVHPEIAWNTGNVGRTCLAVNARLHLIEPLGFDLSDKRVKRAGLDYWHDVDLSVWKSWSAFSAGSPPAPALTRSNCWFFSAEAETHLWSADLALDEDVVLVFGRETGGLPESLRHEYRERLVCLPMQRSAVRSLNLSTSAALGAYEVLRRHRHQGQRI